MTESPASANALGLEGGGDLARAALALARRFSANATMWCLAPEWPEHARHVAVEFVHPVIVGKRALPAIAVPAAGDGKHTATELRVVARSGDILCVVARAATQGMPELMRRAEVWGLTTVWIGAGVRPEPGIADHVLWVDAENPVAAYDGSLVLRYHVLWELTHVCFEHPGLLAEPDAACAVDRACVTCSDEGILAEVMTVDAHGVAAVRTARGDELVDVNLIGPVGLGDVVLIHAGAAIALVGGDDS